MTNIRSFRNADVPVLLELWIQHWSSIGPPPHVNVAKLEQALLSRTFFDPSTLLLAEADGEPKAFCHFAPCSVSEETAVIAAICLDPRCESALSQQLLSAAEQRIAELGFARIRAGVVRDDVQGYAGLEPIGHGIGIPIADSRISQLLEQSGFVPQHRVVRMLATVRAYRPPVSREALQFRRTSKLQSEAVVHDDTRDASGMSHLDIESHRLVDRSGQLLTEVKLWLSDAEAEVMSPGMAILDIAAAHERGRLEPSESYLIGALVQSLGQRRIATVETAVDAEKADLLSQLQTLQFSSVDEGVCWEKVLA